MKIPLRSLIFIVLVVVFATGAQVLGREDNTAKLVGAWTLQSWEIERQDGSKYYPMGPDCMGRLVYTRDGFMSVVLSRKDRPRFKSEGLFDGESGEKSRAVEEYLSYSGRYELEGQKVVHVIDMSLFPNWIGTRQERFIELKNDQLTISTPPFLVKDGRKEIGRLIWVRRK